LVAVSWRQLPHALFHWYHILQRQMIMSIDNGLVRFSYNPSFFSLFF